MFIIVVHLSSTLLMFCICAFQYSMATVEWSIPADAQPGSYRICHYGDSRDAIDGEIEPFEGCSRTFTVNDSSKFNEKISSQSMRGSNKMEENES